MHRQSITVLTLFSIFKKDIYVYMHQEVDLGCSSIKV